MAHITLDDFCLIDTNEVRTASTEYLEDDPACPRDALLRSPAVYDPNNVQTVNTQPLSLSTGMRAHSSTTRHRVLIAQRTALSPP